MGAAGELWLRALTKEKEADAKEKEEDAKKKKMQKKTKKMQTACLWLWLLTAEDAAVRHPTPPH